MLLSTLRRCIHIIVLFSYLNVLMVQSWAGTQAFEEGVHYKLSIKTSRQIQNTSDPTKAFPGELGEGLRLKFTAPDDSDHNGFSQIKLFIPYEVNQPGLLSAGCQELFADGSAGATSLGFSWKTPKLPGLDFLILWDGSLLVKGDKNLDTAPLQLRLSTPGTLALQMIILQSASLKAQQIEFHQNNIVHNLQLNLDQVGSVARIVKGASLMTKVVKMSQGTLDNVGKLATPDGHDLNLQLPNMTVSSQSEVTAHGQLKGNLKELINHGRIVTGQGYDLDVKHLINTQNAQLIGGGDLSVIEVVNHGILGSDQLNLKIAKQFTNAGTTHLQHLSGTITDNSNAQKIGNIDNSGVLRVGGKADLSLPLPFIFTNKGEAEFAGMAHVYQILNTKTLVARAGLATSAWSNTGTADIYGLFNLTNSLPNPFGTAHSVINNGTLNLIDAVVHYSLPAMENRGDLCLTRSTIVKSNPNPAAPIPQLLNHKNLSITGGSIDHLTNYGQLELIGTDDLKDLTIKQLYNYAQMHLFGPHWAIQAALLEEKVAPAPTVTKVKALTARQARILRVALRFNKALEARPLPEIGKPVLRVNDFQNTGTVLAENDLTYAHSNPWGCLQAAGTLSLLRLYETIRPQDLHTLKGDKALEIRTNNFNVDQNINLDIPLLILRLSGDMTINAIFKTNMLEAIVRGNFQIGQSNDQMGELVTIQDYLKLTAASIDARYGKIFTQGPATLIATQGDVVVGAAKSIPANFGRMHVYDLRDPAYNRPIQNGAYIGSNDTLNIQASQKSILINHAQLFSQRNMLLQAWGFESLIQTTSGKLQSNQDIKFFGKKFVATIPDQIYKVGYWNKNGTLMHYHMHMHLECGESSIIQASQNINFENFSSYILGSQLLANHEISKITPYSMTGSLNNKPLGEFNLTVREQPLIHEHFYGDGKYDRTGQLGIPLKSTAKSGKSINVVNSNLSISGTVNAPIIDMRVGTAAFSNPNLSRNTAPPIDVRLDLVEFSKTLYTSDGFIRVLSNGQVTTPYPLTGGLLPKLTQLVLTGPAATTAQARLQSSTDADLAPYAQSTSITTKRLKLLIDPVPFEFVLQQALSEHAGTLNIAGLAGRKLLMQLLINASQYRQQYGAILSTVPRQPMLSYIAREVAGQITLAAQLHVPKGYINPYRDLGDMSGSEISITSTGSQTHLSNRVVAQKRLQILAGDQLHRETLKYNTTTYEGRTRIDQEHAGPQQIFACIDGDAVIHSQGDYREIGATSFAGQNLDRGSLQAQTTINPLILKRTVTQEHTKGKWYGGSSKSSTSTISHQHVASTGTAGQDSTLRSGQNASIALVAPQETAGRDLRITGKDVTANAIITAQETTSSKSSTSMLGGRQSVLQMVQQPEVTRGLLNAGRNLFFDLTDKATINGTDVVAMQAFNNTRGGLSFGPTIAPMYSASTTSASSGLGHMHASQQSMQEVEARTRLCIGKLLSRTSTTTAINVDWLTPRVVDGLYQESFYALKKWQVSQAAASGVFDNNLVAVVSLAITVAAMVMTGGTSAFVTGTLFSQMGQVAGSAALSQLQQQAVISLMRTGDPVATGKELISDESVRSLAITAASAGAFRGMSSYLNISNQPHGFVEQARTQLLKASINTTLQSTIGGQDFVDTWKANMLRAAIDTAAGTAANSIGDLKTEGSINNVTHKVLHGSIGAAMGALLSNDRKNGAIAGAIGAITAEMVAESLTEDAAVCKQRIVDQAKAEGRVLSSNDLKVAYMAEVQKNAEWSKLAGAVATLAIGKDVSVAIAAASNAVENNYLTQQARQAIMQVSGMTPEEAATRANELQQVISDNPELREALQTLGLCAQEVNEQLYELQCLQGREQLRNRTDQDFWHDLQYPLGAADMAAQAEFMNELRASNQPLSMVGRMCQAICVIEDFADCNPSLTACLQDTIQLGAKALRATAYIGCAAGGVILGSAAGSVVPGAGTTAGAVGGYVGGIAIAAGMEYAVDSAVTAIGSSMGEAVNWIKDQAYQAGRTPIERLRFAQAAENGIYGSLTGLGLIAGGRGLKAIPGLLSSAQYTAYTGYAGRMAQQATTVNALNLETKAASGGIKIGIQHEPQFWNKSVQVGKNKVYQRNDLIDPKYIDTKGITNLEKMKNGYAPFGPDDKPINLHHMLQIQDGAIAEVTQTFHQQYTKTIHINPTTMGSGINRNDFGAWRKDYWKLRAKDFE